MTDIKYPAAFTEKAKEVEALMEYVFHNKGYLYEALTHSSYANEQKKADIRCNERLEFLGDSVLSLVVSRYIFTSLRDCPEGELTKIRSFAVCEDALYAFASAVGLGQYLMLGKGEEKTNGRNRKSILADATEALIAAMYLDTGCDMDAVCPFVMKVALPRIEEMLSIEKRGGTQNYKGTLQQIVQNSPGDLLEYEEVEERGPDHAKVFVIRVKLNSNPIGKGEGRSKQEAEQEAAKEALRLFGEKV